MMAPLLLFLLLPGGATADIEASELSRVHGEMGAWTEANTSPEVVAARDDLATAIMRLRQGRESKTGEARWSLSYGPLPPFPGEGKTPYMGLREVGELIPGGEPKP